jgi:hypothetical protein
MNVAGEVLALAAQREAQQIDEKLFLETCAIPTAVFVRLHHIDENASGEVALRRHHCLAVAAKAGAQFRG